MGQTGARTAVAAEALHGFSTEVSAATAEATAEGHSMGGGDVAVTAFV